MKTVVVCEGQSDVLLLQRALSAVVDVADFHVVAAGGRSAAISLARSYLVSRSLPVALVLDADTIDPRQEESGRSFAHQSLLSVAPPERYRLVIAKPQLEAVLFYDRNIAVKLLGRDLTEAEWERSKFDPGRLVNEILSKAGLSMEAALDRLTEDDFRTLAMHPVIHAIVDFVGRNSALTVAS